MINFRFHLVSLIAVFLALGLGILVGSTVIDQGIVDRLDREIRSVRKENSKVEAENSTLSKQNKQLQQYIDDLSPYAGDGRLDDVSVAVVAENGVDGEVIKDTESMLRDAGADVPAVLRLNDSWRLESDSQIQDLQTALNLSGDANTTRDAALDLFAARLTQPATGTTVTTAPRSTPTGTAKTSASKHTTSTTTPVATVDALTALEKAGFLDVIDGDTSSFDTFPTRPPNVVLITGDDSHFAGTDLTTSFLRAVTQAKLPTLLAAAYDPGSDATTAPARGASIAPVLDDQTLSRAVSSVDDVELEQGRAAAVLALQAISSGNLKNVGHYGYGSGAAAPLPPHQS
jgi:hypothetical protein